MAQFSKSALHIFAALSQILWALEASHSSSGSGCTCTQCLEFPQESVMTIDGCFNFAWLCFVLPVHGVSSRYPETNYQLARLVHSDRTIPCNLQSRSAIPGSKMMMMMMMMTTTMMMW